MIPSGPARGKKMLPDLSRDPISWISFPMSIELLSKLLPSAEMVRFPLAVSLGGVFLLSNLLPSGPRFLELVWIFDLHEGRGVSTTRLRDS